MAFWTAVTAGKSALIVLTFEEHSHYTILSNRRTLACRRCRFPGPGGTRSRRKLGLARELIGRRPQPGFEGRGPGGLPGAWQDGLTQEISAELAISAQAAGKLTGTAYALARLPGTAAALEAGIISGLKAPIIAEVTGPLDDTQAAEAGRRAAARLAGKTPGQVRDLVRRIVLVPITVITSSFTSEDAARMASEGHPYFSELARLPVTYVDLPTGHWPMWTRPADLAAELARAATAGQ